MDANEIFLLVVRWLHLVAAAVWVGGSVFYLLVLRPAMQRMPEFTNPLSTAIGIEFRTIVITCIVVLVTTGAILAFDRLTEVEPPYTITLAVKVVLSVWMFLLVRDTRQQVKLLGLSKERPSSLGNRIIEAASGYTTLVILGIVIFLLSDLLKILFEIELAVH